VWRGHLDIICVRHKDDAAITDAVAEREATHRFRIALVDVHSRFWQRSIYDQSGIHFRTSIGKTCLTSQPEIPIIRKRDNELYHPCPKYKFD